MARLSERPLKKITIRVWEADWNLLEEMAHSQDVEPNRLIREMLHRYIIQTEALVRKNIDRLPPPPAFSMDELSDGAQNA
jgi:hypothetical protein